MIVGDKQLTRLWSSLMRLSTGKKPRPELKPQFSRSELRAWIEAQVISPNTPAWKCAYGFPGCSDKKFSIGISEVSLDHKTPVAKHSGGLTTLDNLAISCRRCNEIKGDVDAAHAEALKAFLLGLTNAAYIRSFCTRLRQAPGSHFGRQRAQARAAKAADGDF